MSEEVPTGRPWWLVSVLAAVLAGVAACGAGPAPDAAQVPSTTAPAPAAGSTAPVPTTAAPSAGPSSPGTQTAYTEGYLPSRQAVADQLALCKADGTAPRPVCANLAAAVGELDGRLRPLLDAPGADPTGEAREDLDTLSRSTERLVTDCAPQKATGDPEFCRALATSAQLGFQHLGSRLSGSV